MSEYSPIALAIVRGTRKSEQEKGLMSQTTGSQFFLHKQPTSKVCLFFHGFTALPEQFIPIGQAFYQAGYNVLIPLLPGHGIAGDWDKDNPPPLPENQDVYQQFGLQWLEIARGFGEQIIIGGLSGGSSLSAWLCLECPTQIYRALVFAPYLSGVNKLVDFVVETFDIYFEWKTQKGITQFGYKGFLMPALRIFLDMGEDIINRAKHSDSAPMLIVSSESDIAVGSDEHETLFKEALQQQPKCWYHRFERSLDIPHNMMTVDEGNQHLELLLNVAKAYVESDLTWTEVQEIGDRLIQGYALDTIVNQLNLQQRVSKFLPALWNIASSERKV